MKQQFRRIPALLLAILMLLACSGSASVIRKTEQSNMWSLGDRYQSTYSILRYYASYLVNGELFYLKASRNKKETGLSKNVIDYKTVDGIVYALCESNQIDDDGNALYTYYECYTGQFRYVIGNEEKGFHIERILSVDDAIALIADPASPKGRLKLAEEEWNAMYRLAGCNLEILVRANDKGSLVKSLSSKYEPYTENGETYYISSFENGIAYTDGTHSVQIRQSDRADVPSDNYHTLSECKAVLALLGS